MRYQRIPIGKLTIDKRYQRELDDKRVEKIVTNFDPRLLGVLEVSQRGRNWATFDGQHRLAALRRRKAKDAPCLVHVALTPQQEAELFDLHNRERKAPTMLERFRARLFAGDPIATDINRIIEDRGYSLGRHEGRISAVSALERIYRKQGGSVLDEALRIIRGWNGDPTATSGIIIEGVALMLPGYQHRFDAEKEARLLEQPPAYYVRWAKSRSVITNNAGSLAVLVSKRMRHVAGLRGVPTGYKRRKKVAA